jgi:hypothetical protein
MTQEQGRALEMIGHAADYLHDCCLYEGDENEVIDFGGSPAKAFQILISARQRLVESLPLKEPRMQHLWNVLFHRTPEHASARTSRRSSRDSRSRESRPAIVVPLSSSR